MSQNETPRGGGGGHAIRPCRRMFRKGRPLLPWLHFGLHFGFMLGDQGGTILIWGCLFHKHAILECFFAASYAV